MMRRFLGCVGLSVLALGLAGCGFFVDTTTTTTTTTTPAAATGDYVYVVNPAANTLSGYVVGTNTLTPISGLNPLAVQTGLSPRSVAVTRANTFLYVGGNGAINCYSIGTGGVLTARAFGAVAGAGELCCDGYVAGSAVVAGGECDLSLFGECVWHQPDDGRADDESRACR